MQLIIGTNSILTVSLAREIWMSEENEEEKYWQRKLIEGQTITLLPKVILKDPV